MWDALVNCNPSTLQLKRLPHSSLCSFAAFLVIIDSKRCRACPHHVWDMYIMQQSKHREAKGKAKDTQENVTGWKKKSTCYVPGCFYLYVSALWGRPCAPNCLQNFTQLDLDQRSFWIRPCDPVEQHFNVKPRVSNLLQHTESAIKSIDVSCYKELTEQ